MPKVPYSKPTLSLTDQLAQLKKRGLKVEDDSRTLHLLESIGYYRLSGYWYPMLELPKENHVFKASSSFNAAFKIYCFDKELRKIILSEIEKIEIAVRAKMIFVMSHANGAFWYERSGLFPRRDIFDSCIESFEEAHERSDEQFIKSFKFKYSNPLPPSWMILEISSFGNLSRMYKNLYPSRPRRNVANFFQLDETTFESWLHTLVYIRNVCAHHARLWNRTMSISAKIPFKPRLPWINNTHLPNPKTGLPNVNNQDSTYFLICIITYLLFTINPKTTFKKKLLSLFSNYPSIDLKAMGFPSDWEREALWK